MGQLVGTCCLRWATEGLGSFARRFPSARRRPGAVHESSGMAKRNGSAKTPGGMREALLGPQLWLLSQGSRGPG